MNYTVLSILTAIILTYIAIYALQPLASEANLLDVPTGRKNHQGHVPLIGGLAMYIGVVVSLLITQNELSQFYYFILATGVILALGVIDDLQNTNVTVRLGIQTLVAIFIVTVVGINIESFGNLLGSGEILLNQWSYLVSVIAIVAAMNALNMSDGIHGLAGGTSLITFAVISYLSIGSASQEITLIVLLFCSTIPVFLVNNICIGVEKCKRIFLGDAGSMLLGLVIVWALISLSQGGEGERSFAPVTVLWLFALPLIEMGSIILRRLASGKSPFRPDLLHTHHILIHSGLSTMNALIVLSFFSLFMAITGILGELYGVAEWIMFVGFVLISATHFILCLVFANKTQVDTVYSDIVNRK